MFRIASRRLPRQSTALRSTVRGGVQLRAASRPLSSGCARMAPKLTPLQQPVSESLPSDSYQLLSTSDKAGSAEDALFEQQVQDVKKWWDSPRYEGIKRPYSAEDVVSKRGSLQQTYPSSIMARKLFNLLKERSTQGEPVHTSQSTRKFSRYTIF